MVRALKEAQVEAYEIILFLPSSTLVNTVNQNNITDIIKMAD